MDRLAHLVARIERGAMRSLPPSLVVVANAMIHQRLGEPELHLVKQLVREATVAVDVGGHFGVYSYAMARHVGKRGRVITVEPIEEDADLIERAAKTLKLPISVVRCAASSANGTADLRVPTIGGSAKTALSTLESTAQSGDAGETRTVPTRTLDDILSGIDVPVSFIKIDVEGHELAVIAGADDTLRTHRPNILIEINDDLGNRPAQDVFDAILAHGYAGAFLEEGKARMPLEFFDVERHQRQATGNVLSRAYVNNFIFTPKD